MEFLSEASQSLGASLDYNVTLDSLARLTVPRLADWCDIQMLDDAGVLKRVSMIHRNPALVAMAEEYSRKYPYEAHSGDGVPQPLLAGPMLFPHVTDEILQGYAKRPEELEILRQFGCRSIMLLPLSARQRRLGLMVLAASESGRVYGAADLKLAEELAARASLAVDNARLYAAEQQARALAEEALRARIASERQLTAILDHSPAMIYVSDRQSRLVLVNREYEKRTQRTAAELIGRTVDELLPKPQAEFLYALDQRVMNDKVPVTFEFDVGQGTGRSYFSLKFPLTDSDGNVTGLCGMATDVSARKHAEEALRLSQERFEKVFRAATIAITISRAHDGHVIDANPAAQALCGYTLAEMVGKTTSELGLWADDDGRERAFSASALRGGGTSNFESRLRDRHGKLHDVLMTLEVIELAGQTCYVALAQEVTELKQLNLRLERVHKMEALGRLAGGIAHDFNNILTAINGYSRLVLDGAPPSSAIHASAVHIERAAQRAAGLTQQLLVFGRQQVQERAVVDLNAAVRNLLAMLRRLIDEDVKLETTLD
ncbi:MAG TPA: PAS domain S-box protein, partial [Polyangia bacterium]|nr:PAS domain S-box protein [Polyangia bacterium]